MAEGPVRAAVAVRGDACRNLHTMPEPREPALPAVPVANGQSRVPGPAAPVANGHSRGPGPAVPVANGQSRGPGMHPGCPGAEATTARAERPRPRCESSGVSARRRFCRERPVEEFTECGICFENVEPLSFCDPTREQAKSILESAIILQIRYTEVMKRGERFGMLESRGPGALSEPEIELKV